MNSLGTICFMNTDISLSKKIPYYYIIQVVIVLHITVFGMEESLGSTIPSLEVPIRLSILFLTCYIPNFNDSNIFNGVVLIPCF